MNVTLMNYTTEAKELLIFSKKTRLKMSPTGYQDIVRMSDEEKDKELKYVFVTIGSSWEFIDYVFMIEGVTRAFTHQLVRHRVGVSFAQQAQRVVNMGDFEYLSTGSAENCPSYHLTMTGIKNGYQKLIGLGIHPQDARGVLPTNILTNILMKVNLRSLSGILNKRLCVKAQGEFQGVARVMRDKVIEVHPWAEPVLQVECVQYGSCAFKGYSECPVKKEGYLTAQDADAIKKIWETTRSEAQPKEAK